MKREFLKKGYTLFKGDYIQNELGVTLILQDDGNLVLYDDITERNHSNVLWAGSDKYNWAERLVFKDDGNLVLYNKYDEIVWESKTKDTNSNLLIIDEYNVKLIYAPKGRILAENLENPNYILKHNKGLFDKPIKVGVVLIGSLLWQNDGNNGEKDLRKNWREQNFEEKYIPVKFPIRYGRMSSGNVYTMVVSESCTAQDKLGTAMLLMANKTFESVADVYNFALEIAKAEGMASNSKAVLKLSWALIAYAKKQSSTKFNNDVENRIDKIWGSRASSGDFYETLKMDDEANSPINKKGELVFLKNWLKAENTNDQKLLDELDFVLSTVTQPRYKKGNNETKDDLSRYPNNDELVVNVLNDKQRFYFYNNIIHGIKTFQDKDILNNQVFFHHDERKQFELSKMEFYKLPNDLLYFSSNGEIILYNLNDSKMHWKSPKNPMGVKLKYQSDGNLVIYDYDNNPVWSADVFHHKGINKNTLDSYILENYLNITNEGQLQVVVIRINKLNFAEVKKIVWLSEINCFHYNEVINESFNLKKGSTIFLQNYSIVFSEDGQILLYDLFENIIWNSPDDKKGNKLSYQDDGNLVIYDNDNSKWSTNTHYYKGLSDANSACIIRKELKVIDNKITAITKRNFKEIKDNENHDMFLKWESIN